MAKRRRCNLELESRSKSKKKKGIVLQAIIHKNKKQQHQAHFNRNSVEQCSLCFPATQSCFWHSTLQSGGNERKTTS